MALFSLTDIKFRQSDDRRGRGVITDDDPKFSTQLLKYPEDLGSVDKGHYMIFYVNVSNLTTESYPCRVEGPNSQSNSGSGGLTLRRGIDAIALTNAGKSVSEITDKIKSSVQIASPNVANVANYISNVVTGAASPLLNVKLNRLTEQNFARQVTRISDSIALYMPNTLAFNYSQVYDTLRRNDALTGIAAAAMSSRGSITDPTALGNNLSPFIGQLASGPLGALTRSPDTIRSVFAQLFGAVNPRLEMIYSSPQFRPLQFDFMFYPRSEKEALEVQKIIQRFKFHQAPEIKKGTENQFLVPPSDFNIQFYYNGKVNDNIPKVKGPCILESINVDYAPDGFRAYESYGDKNNILSPELGKTGMPVGIRMTLAFREIEFMTKDAYRKNDV
jgi:hypothetical protein